MDGLPFAVALMTTDELRNGDVATIEYLLPSFSITSPTSVKPTTDATTFPERAPVTAAIVEEALLGVEPSDDESLSEGDERGGLTGATSEDVPGKMC